MKRVKIALCILLAVALFTWWATNRLGNILGGFVARLDAVDEALVTGVGLEEACLSAEEYWIANEKELVRLISQYMVDDVCSTIVRLTPLSAIEEKKEFESELRVLRHKIEELWEAHSPSLSSLF